MAIFAGIRDWSKRKNKEDSSQMIARNVFGIGMRINGGTVIGISPHLIVDMSTIGRFDAYIQGIVDINSQEFEVKVRDFVCRHFKKDRN
jgi:hypothetical protein